MNISTSDPSAIRALAGRDDFTSVELFKGSPSGHLFKPGDTCVLTGLQDFPEFNGTTVEITNIRDDGPHGRAYYIDGAISKFVNWIYEYRLQPVNQSQQ